jgi:hypothetical protein
MGIDEEGTLAQIKALRRTLFDPKVTEHRRRIVKNTGDGALVEFAGVVDARAMRRRSPARRGRTKYRRAAGTQDRRVTSSSDAGTSVVGTLRSAATSAMPPLLGDKRTSRGEPISVAIDPERTLCRIDEAQLHDCSRSVVRVIWVKIGGPMTDLGMPDTRYAHGGDINIAYQTIGHGRLDIGIVPGSISHVEFNHELPGFAAFLHRLSGFARVVTFDKRGRGLSNALRARLRRSLRSNGSPSARWPTHRRNQGAGLKSTERGVFDLKGIPGRWDLCAAAQ